jgi:DNA (cytosine-5)-methyltransferase 1
VNLLPTPTAHLGEGGEAKNLVLDGTVWRRPSGVHASQDLRNTVRLLPTPCTMDPSENMTPEEFDIRLGRCVWNEERWGRYAEAIARWEQVMGLAPEPTTGEKPRLNPDFVEWMMGYRSGWTFGTRTQRLKQLGNSVVPPQGEYAIKRLLEQN